MATRPTPTPPEPDKIDYDVGHVPINEEFDNAKHTMPDAAPVIISIIVLGIVLGIFAYVFRAKPVAGGRIDEAFAVDVVSQPQTVLATVRLTLRNVGKRTLVLRNVTVKLQASGKDFADDSASVADFGRYFIAFPELREHSVKGIARGSKIPPGAEISGSVIVSFPVSKAQFDQRTGLAATVSFEDQNPVEIRQ